MKCSHSQQSVAGSEALISPGRPLDGVCDGNAKLIHSVAPSCGNDSESKSIPTSEPCRNVEQSEFTSWGGGIPCQPFSGAGRKLGTSDDRNLWPAMLNAVKHFRPDWVVVENVTHSANMVLSGWQDDLESISYQSQAFHFSACAVGLQTMERHVWLVAARDGYELEGDASTIVSRTAISPKRHQNCAGHEELLRRPALPTPQLLRSRKGFPNFVDRIKSIGNAFPPQCTYVIGQAINEIEEGLKT